MLETIYFIREEDSKNIKIGKVGNQKVKKRLSQLQVGNSSKLTLISTLKAEKGTEELLHERFNKYNKRGEWFFPSKEILTYVNMYTSVENKNKKKVNIEIINYIERSLVSFCKFNKSFPEYFIKTEKPIMDHTNFFIIPFKRLSDSLKINHYYYLNHIFEKFGMSNYNFYMKHHNLDDKVLDCIFIPMASYNKILNYEFVDVV